MTGERPTVVILHGLARTERSTAALRRRLTAAGFPTWTCTYPSRRLAIADAADWVFERVAAELAGRRLAAVTHSLGGIVARHLDERVGFERIVMLAPPSQASRVAAALHERPLFRWFYGPAGQELAGPPRWPVPAAPFAVIAGTRGHSPANPARWLRRAVPALAWDEPNDGTVAVAETRLDSMAAFAEVDATHTWIMGHPEAQRLCIRFLEEGTFD